MNISSAIEDLNLTCFSNEYKKRIDRIQISILSLIMIVSIGLNLLLMLAFIKNRKKIEFSNSIYMSNCVADMVVGLLLIPFYIAELSFDSCFGSVAYVLGYTLDYSLNNISIYNLVVITFHRYFQLKFPLKSTEKMSKSKHFILAMVWILVILFWLMSNIILSVNTVENNCNIDYPFSFTLFASIVFYIIPLVLVFILNILTFIQLKKRNRLKQSLVHTSSHASSSSNSSHYHFIRSYICLKPNIDRLLFAIFHNISLIDVHSMLQFDFETVLYYINLFYWCN